MAVQTGDARQSPAARAGTGIYSRPPGEVAAALDVDPAAGLAAARAAELLAATGLTRCRRRNPGQDGSGSLRMPHYMQIILVGAAVVSLLVKEWSTAVLLLLLTVLNAVVGLRQEGKAESAMNAP